MGTPDETFGAPVAQHDRHFGEFWMRHVTGTYLKAEFGCPSFTAEKMIAYSKVVGQSPGVPPYSLLAKPSGCSSLSEVAVCKPVTNLDLAV